MAEINTEISDTLFFDNDIIIEDYLEEFQQQTKYTVNTIDDTIMYVVANIDYDTNIPNKVDDDLKSLLIYDCYICRKEYDSIDLVAEHIHVEHKKVDNICDICNKEFKAKNQLNVHMKIHLDEKKYVCHTCNKLFMHKSTLNKHYLTHGEKKYECRICDKKFTYKSKLAIHINYHERKKTYKCDICDKTFLESSNLKRHIRIHTEERPYICNVCKRAFTDPSTFNRHKRIHNRKIYKCKECERKYVNFIRYEQHVLEHGNGYKVDENVDVEEFQEEYLEEKFK